MNSEVKPNNPEIYIVQLGQYSDQRIVGVFTDRAKAQRLFNLCLDGDEFVCMETYDADTATGFPPNKFFFQVAMRRDGYVKRVEKLAPIGDWQTPLNYVWEDTLNNTCWARDADHAAKITNDVRRQLIAEGEF